jgi:LPS-assembly protein
MLGYPTVSLGRIFSVNRHFHARNLSALRPFLLLMALCLPLACLNAQAVPESAQGVPKSPGKGGIAELSSTGPQRRQGAVTIADGEVDIHYGNQRLRADHMEYNDQTNEALARGHVQYDYESQHLEADEAHYNVGTGRGTFLKVRGTVKIERRANPTVLITTNPLYFEAQEVEKFGNDLYLIRQAWVTVCDPEHPKWQFYATHARVRVDKTMALVNVNFRLIRVPLVWLPYASVPAGQKVRQSGFLIPEPGQSNRKGYIIGDAFYWAPTSWLDTTLGAQYMSQRGSSERAQFRAKPWQDTSIKYSYYGVVDRGVPTVINAGLATQSTALVSQGGHEQQLEVQSLLKDNWRFVADVNQLTSLTFRLAFADTFGDAINSEVRSSIFLTHNFHGFSLNVADRSDKNFLSINPQQSVFLRNAPEGRFSSVEQAPWRRLPVYFGFDALAGGVHRDDSEIDTPGTVARTEFAPRVTIPLHFGPWLSATATAAFRTTYYGDSLVAAATIPTLSGRSVVRNDGEFALDLRLPTLERFYPRARSQNKFKHTIEPEITYRLVTGINNFAQLIRFDADSTLSNTNEIEYGITQRLWVKHGEDQPTELISWRLVQKHFFDPTFGGAVVPGTRNVFQTLEQISPFSFADNFRSWSPLVSDFKITPGGPVDFEQILEYDTQRAAKGQLTTIGTLAKIKPYKELSFTIADFRLDADPLILQPRANQIRTLVGYGSQNRKGFNVTLGVGYDVTNGSLQNQLVQIGYNGGCCGFALEYRRIALGQVRTENQWSGALIIANIGRGGNLHRQDRIF